MDEPLSNSPEKEQGGLFIIDGNTEVGEPYIFGRCTYSSVFYCLFYVKYMSTAFFMNRCQKKEMLIQMRSRISEYMTLGVSIGGVLLSMVTIKRIFVS